MFARSIFVFCLFLSLSLSATVRRSLPVEGQWFNTANWQGGTIPQLGDSVIIAEGANISYFSFASAGFDTAKLAYLQIGEGNGLRIARLQVGAPMLIQGLIWIQNSDTLYNNSTDNFLYLKGDFRLDGGIITGSDQFRGNAGLCFIGTTRQQAFGTGAFKFGTIPKIIIHNLAGVSWNLPAEIGVGLYLITGTLYLSSPLRFSSNIWLSRMELGHLLYTLRGRVQGQLLPPQDTTIRYMTYAQHFDEIYNSQIRSWATMPSDTDMVLNLANPYGLSFSAISVIKTVPTAKPFRILSKFGKPFSQMSGRIYTSDTVTFNNLRSARNISNSNAYLTKAIRLKRAFWTQLRNGSFLYDSPPQGYVINLRTAANHLQRVNLGVPSSFPPNIPSYVCDLVVNLYPIPNNYQVNSPLSTLLGNSVVRVNAIGVAPTSYNLGLYAFAGDSIAGKFRYNEVHLAQSPSPQGPWQSLGVWLSSTNLVGTQQSFTKAVDLARGSYFCLATDRQRSDISLSSMEGPSEWSAFCGNGQLSPFRLIVDNKGSQSISSYAITATLNDTIINQYLFNNTLEARRSDTLKFEGPNGLWLTHRGKLKLFISNGLDANKSNDTLKVDLQPPLVVPYVNNFDSVTSFSANSGSLPQRYYSNIQAGPSSLNQAGFSLFSYSPFTNYLVRANWLASNPYAQKLWFSGPRLKAVRDTILASFKTLIEDVSGSVADLNVEDTVALEVSSNCGYSFDKVAVLHSGNYIPNGNRFLNVSGKYAVPIGGEFSFRIAARFRQGTARKLSIDSLNFSDLIRVDVNSDITSKLIVSPNPSASQCQILFGSIMLGGVLEIRDHLGRLRLMKKISGSINVDTSNWTNGIYLIAATQGKHRSECKLVVSN